MTKNKLAPAWQTCELEVHSDHGLSGEASLLDVQHLLVPLAGGALHPGGQPVHAHCLAGGGHLHKQAARAGRPGWRRSCPGGLAEAQRAKLATVNVEPHQASRTLSFSVPFPHRDHPGVLVTYCSYAAVEEVNPATITVERGGIVKSCGLPVLA